MPSKQPISPSEKDWVHAEIGAGVDFGDRRLNRRFEQIAESVAKRPSLPINHAAQDWASTKAAYRFFDNPRVTSEEILSAHVENTLTRIRAQERAVLCEDTTTLDFSRHHKTRGLGMTSRPKADLEMRGLFFHTTLALSAAGLPLGLVDHQIWARNGEQEERNKRLSSYEQGCLSRAEKESKRWFVSLEHLSKACPETQLIFVADREADIYEFFAQAEQLGVDFVIRAQHDRMLIEEDLGFVRLSELLAQQSLAAEVEIRIPSNGTRARRSASLELRYAPVLLSKDGRGVKSQINKDREDLGLYVVELKEREPPRGQKPLHWLLWTSFVVQAPEDALEVVGFYKMRWRVEEYFKCLKTGCNVERTRLMEAERIVKYTSLLSIIAWRILWMMVVARSDGEAACTAVFTENEWHTLWIRNNRKRIRSGNIPPIPPPEIPSVRETIRWLAMTGGFLGRKGDGEPGMITIWRGWLELYAAVEMYETLLPALKKQKPTSEDVGHS